MPTNKKWWMSRTVWLNIFSAVLAMLTALTGGSFGLSPQISWFIMAAIAVVNIVLRFISVVPLDRSLV